MTTLKLTQVGNSTGLVLPKELLVKLGLERGDSVYVTESEEGLVISPYDPKMERLIKIAERGERKYRNALRELAK